jgi:hypothetical protein
VSVGADVAVDSRPDNLISYKAGTTTGVDDVVSVEIDGENANDFFFTLRFQMKKTTNPTISVNKAPPRTLATIAPALIVVAVVVTGSFKETKLSVFSYRNKQLHTLT